ncbi:histamine N-methyltransferase-like [Ptychodera flava]|uniref:histamine N-methyltransferase-like n=1 Tax=Ptychodera flava TaxID=63121 RepID=UPI00396A7BCC
MEAIDTVIDINHFEFAGQHYIQTEGTAIGSKLGVSDIPIIDVLINRFQRIDYTVVEPDEVEISRFKELVASYHENGKWNAVDFKFNMVTIEQYLQRLEDNVAAETTKFDVIHTQHCAYHFQNPEIVFEKLYWLLKENGMLFNVMDFGAWDDLAVKIQQMYNMPEMKSYSAATLREIMKSRLPEAYLRTILCRNIKVNECFKEDSEEGNEMIDFLVQLLDFRKTALEENVNEVEEFLKKSCLHSGRDMIFPANEEATVFVKSK